MKKAVLENQEIKAAVAMQQADIKEAQEKTEGGRLQAECQLILNGSMAVNQVQSSPTTSHLHPSETAESGMYTYLVALANSHLARHAEAR